MKDGRTLDPATASALRNRRQALGLTQDRAASLIGVAQSYLSRVETGGVPVSGGQVIRLLSAYDRIEGSRPEANAPDRGAAR